ncbi:MAG: hypothetical protein PW845_10840 [Pseudomonas sp.]|uniref:DUF7673 family protein n=1 Tax=Pseudomonas abieticivorans TaxID=2931382 RepID=UPI0020BEC365|nr:hypothetical protein [Pseudomonas sp. PIA16]MDE1165862.1 hypothetical protein [Pseudomonas sp.]
MIPYEAKPTPVHKTIVGEKIIAAIRILIRAATTGESDAEPVAAFLLAWHDPIVYGGFSIQDLWGMEESARNAAAILFAWISDNRATPQDLELELVFEAIGARWAN